MTDSKVLPQIEKLLMLAPGTLTGEEKLKDYPRWDSLTMIEFIAMVDEEFGRDIPPDDVRKCERVKDLAALAG